MDLGVHRQHDGNDEIPSKAYYLHTHTSSLNNQALPNNVIQLNAHDQVNWHDSMITNTADYITNLVFYTHTFNSADKTEKKIFPN